MEELYEHGVLSDPYSYVFGLNTEIYQVNLILQERHDISYISSVLVNIVNAHVSIVKHNKQNQIKIEKIRLAYLPVSQICFSGFGTEQLPPHSSFFTITKDLVLVPFVPQPVHALHVVGAN